MEIILASQSPRRRELLKKICAEFRVIPSRIEEESCRREDPLQFALAAAEAKARDVGEKHPGSLIIAADTLVCMGNEAFGKPGNYEEAEKTLEKLSGRKHRVITAVALFHKEKGELQTGYEISYVRFKNLSREDIDAYLEKNEYMDKAGSYAIQEAGNVFVEKLQGDYDNVVGLPVRRVRKLLDCFLTPELAVRIEDMALPEAWGVAKAGGAVTFVPGAVIGDGVRIKIEKKKRGHYFGRLTAVEQPSPFRVEPECPHFGVCGGCAFQNLHYAKQLEIKERYLFETLRRIGRIEPRDLETEAIVPSPYPFSYRNKMEYAFGGEAGSLFLGLRRRATPLSSYRKEPVPLEMCPIFSPHAGAVFRLFTDFAGRSGLPPYDPVSRRGFFRNLVLREGKRTGQLQAVLVTRSGGRLDFHGLIEAAGECLPQLKSLWWVENDRISDVVDFEEKTLVSGEPHIDEELGGWRFRISPEMFFQPNPSAAEILYSRILEEARMPACRKILGLYCGPGSIEMFLSPAAGEIVGIDSEAANIRMAESNRRRNRIANCRFIEGRVESVLKAHSFSGFDLLVVDPPRAGVSGKGLKLIRALNIPRIFYVSCNPAALARDMYGLSEYGYSLQKLFCFDFFPHTPHLESLAVLSRG